ncbi:hypothetical protein H0H92_013281 [Tricholoma furcatifolium]|nr:hypothetical protein H0H92_013281 [Tricholoma furcatifolium]
MCLKIVLGILQQCTNLQMCTLDLYYEEEYQWQHFDPDTTILLPVLTHLTFYHKTWGATNITLLDFLVTPALKYLAFSVRIGDDVYIPDVVLPDRMVDYHPEMCLRGVSAIRIFEAISVPFSDETLRKIADGSLLPNVEYIGLCIKNSKSLKI